MPRSSSIRRMRAPRVGAADVPESALSAELILVPPRRRARPSPLASTITSDAAPPRDPQTDGLGLRAQQTDVVRQPIRLNSGRPAGPLEPVPIHEVQHRAVQDVVGRGLYRDAVRLPDRRQLILTAAEPVPVPAPGIAGGEGSLAL